jgi:hypothetical protein
MSTKLLQNQKTAVTRCLSDIAKCRKKTIVCKLSLTPALLKLLPNLDMYKLEKLKTEMLNLVTIKLNVKLGLKGGGWELLHQSSRKLRMPLAHYLRPFLERCGGPRAPGGIAHREPRSAAQIPIVEGWTGPRKIRWESSSFGVCRSSIEAASDGRLFTGSEDVAT